VMGTMPDSPPGSVRWILKSLTLDTAPSSDMPGVKL
jgi:hypothetical protein